MSRRWVAALVLVGGLAGCKAVPPLDTLTVGQARKMPGTVVSAYRTGAHNYSLTVRRTSDGGTFSVRLGSKGQRDRCPDGSAWPGCLDGAP